jgi:hypothetical protein
MTTDRTPIILNPLLSADWHLPNHFTPIPETGTTIYGGNIVFGFTCKCASLFRQDYRSVSEFDKAVVALLVWADKHRHDA